MSWNIGEKCYFVHLNYIATNAIIKKINMNSYGLTYTVAFNREKDNKLIETTAYQQELFKDKDSYDRIMAKMNLNACIKRFSIVEKEYFELQNKIKKYKEILSKEQIL